MPLEAYVHETAREMIDQDVAQLSERRTVITAFCMIIGVEDIIDDGEAALDLLQVEPDCHLIAA